MQYVVTLNSIIFFPSRPVALTSLLVVWYYEGGRAAAVLTALAWVLASGYFLDGMPGALLFAGVVPVFECFAEFFNALGFLPSFLKNSKTPETARE